MSESYGLVCRPIPHEERRRVFIAGYGYGHEIDRVTLRGALYGVGVVLDSGPYQTFSPCQIVEPPVPIPIRSAEIIQFPARFRMMGDPA